MVTTITKVSRHLSLNQMFCSNGQLEAIRRLVPVQLEPVAALASLWLVLENPEPLDVSVLLVAHTADHAIGVHGVDNVGVFLGSLPALARLQEEGILKRQCQVIIRY